MASHDKPETCPPSEFSHGEGMYPNPEIDFDNGKVNRGINYTQVDFLRDKAAMARRNIDSPDETLEELYYAKGNPDRYGGHPPLVKQKPCDPDPPKDLREPIRIFEREG